MRNRSTKRDLASTIFTFLALVYVCCFLVPTVRALGLDWLLSRPALGVVSMGILLMPVAYHQLARWWGGQLVRRWAAREGWSAVDSRVDWPWATTGHRVDPPRVRRAFAKGDSVVGEVVWGYGAMREAVDQGKGSGHFVVLRLAQPYPLLGVRRKVRSRDWQPGLADFPRHFWTIFADEQDAAAHIGPELRALHVAGTMPNWVIVGDELYLVEPTSQALTPRSAVALVGQARTVARLVAQMAGS